MCSSIHTYTYRYTKHVYTRAHTHIYCIYFINFYGLCMCLNGCRVRIYIELSSSTKQSSNQRFMTYLT